MSIASLAMAQQNDQASNIHVEMAQLAASIGMSQTIANVNSSTRWARKEPAPLKKPSTKSQSRVVSKLNGRDFFDDDSEPLNVMTAQVQRLITQAGSHENLCQCYIVGWCRFW
ncbi:hypothetical protein DYB32_009940 [Aphanomyces invadans]|uniref:FATC domain-containing protein n=1 Tax=Aphanomyces invadans TaxID=157072 RepID=A0A418AH30_9STRA|nr:hypothetical protein DYB32_009940 [Aphanomyces invadans]